MVFILSSPQNLTPKEHRGMYCSMNTTQTTERITLQKKVEQPTPYRDTAVTSLAVIGFVALIGLGVWGAIYSSRYVPNIVGRAGTAAVYLGSLFNPTTSPAGDVSVPAATSTQPTVISFGTPAATSTTPVASSTPSTPKPAATPATPRTITVATTVPAPALSGVADLTTSITVIGYLTTSATDSFVGSGVVPAGKIPAVKFTIKNVGTNYSGTWRFSASLPSRNTFVYHSDAQQSLAPGDSIDYILGFDRATTGANQTISITANDTHTANETNLNNNTATANLTIE